MAVVHTRRERRESHRLALIFMYAAVRQAWSPRRPPGANGAVDIRRVQASGGLALGASVQGRPFDRLPFAQANGQMHADLAAYLALPYSPGEPDLYQEVEQQVNEFVRAIDRVLTRLKAGDRPGARGLLLRQALPQAERADAALGRLIDFNAARLSMEQMLIARAHRRGMQLTYALHGLAALIAVLLMVLAARAAWARRRLVEGRQRLAEGRAQELEQFSRRVAHDLKGPLGSMSLRLQYEQRHLDGDEPARAALSRLSTGVSAMNRIIDGLLEFSLSGGRPEPGAAVALHDALDGAAAAVRPHAEREGATIEVEPGGALRVACTPGALSSVLHNLLGNAVKYIVDGEQPDRRIRVRALPREERRVRVEVEDTGPGIPPGLEQVIFEPFARGHARQPGLGLGLATVKRIVEAYGGQVEVESTPGRGSRFWFELPEA